MAVTSSRSPGPSHASKLLPESCSNSMNVVRMFYPSDRTKLEPFPWPSSDCVLLVFSHADSHVPPTCWPAWISLSLLMQVPVHGGVFPFPALSLFLIPTTTCVWSTPGPLSVGNSEVPSSRENIYLSFPCVLTALFIQKVSVQWFAYVCSNRR